MKKFEVGDRVKRSDADDSSIPAYRDMRGTVTGFQLYNSEGKDTTSMPSGEVNMSPEKLTFGQVLEKLKRGFRVTRPGWNGKGMWLALQVPTDSSKMTLPYIYTYTADKQLVPWLASQTDMLAEDWQTLVKECEEE